MNIIITHLPPKPGCNSNLYAGRPIVIAALIEAFLKYSPENRIIVYTPSSLRDKYQYYRNDYSNPDKLELMDAETIGQSIGVHESTVIHTFNTSLRYGLHLRCLCGLRPWPVIGMTHDLSSCEVFEELLLAHIVPPAPYDAIICTTKCAQIVLRNLIDRVSTTVDRESHLQLPIIALGVDVSSFKLGGRESARRILELDESCPTLLYLGRISHTMKADLIPLLTAFSRVKCDLLPELVIAGGVLSEREEESVSRIKDYITELKLDNKIRVLTNVTPQQRIELLSAADVLVSPVDSLQESFGLVLLEAMAAELPIIASDWNGYREVIDDSKTGILVETIMPNEDLDDVSNGMLSEDRFWWYGEFSQSVVINLDQLTNAMTTLIEDPELAHRMGSAGRERVQKYFDWKHIVLTYQQEWERLTNIAKASDYSIQFSPYSYVHSDVFRMHATKKLDSNVIIQKKRHDPQILYPLINPPPFLSSKTLFDILEKIESPTRIQDITLPISRINRYVAYLLKQGLAEIVDG